MFLHLQATVRHLTGDSISDIDLERLAFSVVGQCLYYRVGHDVMNLLVGPERRTQQYDIESLATHISRVTLAAMKDFSKSTSK